MPQEAKIKSKDLSYEATLPPFLQRLHAQKAGRGDEDRHERPVARPTRVKTADEDDGPTVVDEGGETVSKEELEQLAKGESAEESGLVRGESIGDGEPKASGALPNGDGDGTRSEQKVTDGTAVKKRKVGKVIGEDGEEGKGNGGQEVENETPMKKFKKKGKPIKLAFDDDEGG